jgi:hypothetical protein
MLELDMIRHLIEPSVPRPFIEYSYILSTEGALPLFWKEGEGMGFFDMVDELCITREIPVASPVRTHLHIGTGFHLTPLGVYFPDVMGLLSDSKDTCVSRCGRTTTCSFFYRKYVGCFFTQPAVC